MISPETCPHCGAEVPPDAPSCPECGSCDRTGWSEEADLSGLGIPEQDFDYDDFLRREFGEEKKVIPEGVHWFWWVVGLIVAMALLLLLLF